MHVPVITIRPDGQIDVIYYAKDVNLGYAGVVITNWCGAHVLPSNIIYRCAFKMLRRLFGNQGRVSDWIRNWQCGFSLWRASDGKRLPGVYHGHDKAVEAKVKMLERGEL